MSSTDIAQACDKYAKYAIVGGSDGWNPVFCTASGIIGMEKLMISMHLNPEFARLFLEKITDFFYELSARMLEASKGKIDIFMIGDDYGTQRGFIMSSSQGLLEDVPLENIVVMYKSAKEFSTKYYRKNI